MIGLIVVLILVTTIAITSLFSPLKESQNKAGTQRLQDGLATAKGRVDILVLGDIARSPRMRNHATSFARHGVAVDLIGYVGMSLRTDFLARTALLSVQESELPVELAKSERITIRRIPLPPRFLQRGGRRLFVVFGPLKVLFQVAGLLWILLFKVKPAKWLIVQVRVLLCFNESRLRFCQNPPSIPTLAVAASVCPIRRTSLVIDWHNYGYSILALKLGQKHPLVRISHIYETFFSSFSTLNFTVSEAMRKQLQRDFGITSPLVTLYDRPTAQFAPVTAAQRLEILKTVVPESQWDLLERGRVKCVASSTSWTPDEDFSILLDALVAYSELATTKKPSLPELCVVITGKGPQKGTYLRKIAALESDGKLEMVSIKTPWFPSVADYARLLASADLGVSLHTSSSGVDLPMKVVDMLGAGTPVAGWNKYESWRELVREGDNGCGFQSSEELTRILVELMGDAGSGLARLRAGALHDGKRRWEEEWDDCAGKLLGCS